MDATKRSSKNLATIIIMKNRTNLSPIFLCQYFSVFYKQLNDHYTWTHSINDYVIQPTAKLSQDNKKNLVLNDKSLY